MSEKKQNIKDGNNIELDGVTVLNNVSVAEKAEEKKEEEKTTETEAKEVEPQVSENDKKEEVTPEIPIIPTPSQNNDEPIIPAIDNVIPVGTDLPTSMITTPEVTPINIPVSSAIPNIGINDETVIPAMDNVVPFKSPEVSYDQNFGNNFDYQQNNGFANDQFNFASNNFSNNNNSFGYSKEVSMIPGGVENALDQLRGEILKAVGDNAVLREENNKLSLENNDLRAQLASKDAKIQNLKNNMTNMQNQVANMQARVLDMFGMGGISPNNQNAFGQTGFNDNDLNNGRNMAA